MKTEQANKAQPPIIKGEDPYANSNICSACDQSVFYKILDSNHLPDTENQSRSAPQQIRLNL